MSAPPDDDLPPRLGRAARRRGWSFDRPLLLPSPRSRLAWSLLEFVTPVAFFVIGILGSKANGNGLVFDMVFFLSMPLAISLASSLRSSVGPDLTVGDIGVLRRTLATRDITEFITVNDVRATARRVDGRRLTLFWLHAGSYAHAWDEAPVIADHLRAMIRVARRHPPAEPASGRVVKVSVIWWRAMFWAALVACAPLTSVLGSILG